MGNPGKLIRVMGAALGLTLLGLVPLRAETLRVFAAASLTDALDEVLKVCSAETGLKATGVFAGSGTIARQIEQGAPAAIYISANPQWMDWAEKRGLIVEDTRIDLLGNSLVVVGTDAEQRRLTSHGVGLPPDFRIAIGETQSVPAGIYGRQALESRGWWEDFQGVLIEASNVREVLTWVLRGEVSIGIVYRTDAVSEDRAVILDEFSDQDHDPIYYPAAVVSDNDTQNARRLLTCLRNEKASEVFARFGFASRTK